MARFEYERENLIQEATALVERVEFAPSSPEDNPFDSDLVVGGAPVVVGFRACGAASFFFGQDPVYHFNSQRELRRAFCDNRLFKSEQGRLVALRRQRQQGEVQLVRHDLSDQEQTEFLDCMLLHLGSLLKKLQANELKIIGQVPPGVDLLGRVVGWVASFEEVTIAASPGVK